jgi:hypothetical protein
LIARLLLLHWWLRQLECGGSPDLPVGAIAKPAGPVLRFLGPRANLGFRALDIIIKIIINIFV